MKTTNSVEFMSEVSIVEAIGLCSLGSANCLLTEYMHDHPKAVFCSPVEINTALEDQRVRSAVLYIGAAVYLLDKRFESTAAYLLPDLQVQIFLNVLANHSRFSYCSLTRCSASKGFNQLLDTFAAKQTPPVSIHVARERFQFKVWVGIKGAQTFKEALVIARELTTPDTN